MGSVHHCPIAVDYTTDEAVLAGMLNNYRLVVHRLLLRTERNYVLTPIKVRTIPTGASA